jgi:hypothetical protein
VESEGLVAEKVGLSNRDRLHQVVVTRLRHYLKTPAEEVSLTQLASLITDDILASGWNVDWINNATQNGMDAGYEKALREAISALGELERTAGYENGPENLVEYQEGQKHIARLSKRGLEELWEGEKQ